ncbi:uncharacterized protein K02A2.6-like [Wyeomyia smithii]|uniref:uncharacterized protein K02A2.6-like n=1 Tax=Wyeomyia smithii TaxID=174621 RepID=UPI002467E68B|nr:uncharacterized protein K02A2.6-like [Wyeomyia smithii]
MYYLVIVDSFTKWPEIFQTSSSTAPLTIGLLRETLARFGKPDALVTDDGSQFCSGIFKQFCEKSGIILVRTTPYHPQSNGQAERFVDTLKRSLRKITDGENIQLSEALQTFLQVYRSTPSNVLEGKYPAEVMFGRPMTTTLDLLRPTGIHQAQSTSTSLSPSATTLTAGAMVYAKVHKNAQTWTWKPGTIIGAFGKVNFNVLLDQGTGRRKLIRSHANQLRARYDDIQQPSHEVHPPSAELIANFRLPAPVQSNLNPEPSTSSGSRLAIPINNSADSLNETMRTASPTMIASTPIVIPLRNDEVTPRPVRYSRPPRRLEDYIRY